MHNARRALQQVLQQHGTLAGRASGLLPACCCYAEPALPALAHAVRQWTYSNAVAPTAHRSMSSAPPQQPQQETGTPSATSSSSPNTEASSSSGGEEASAQSASTSTTSSSSSTASGDSSEGASTSSSSSSSSGGFGSTFSSFKERLGGAAGGGGEAKPLGERLSGLQAALLRDLKAAVLPQTVSLSATRAYDGPVYQAPEGGASDATALAMVQREKTSGEKILEDLKARFGHHPLFRRLAGMRVEDNPVYKKGAELADTLRDKYETSDHPMVHKAEEVKERMFGMSDAATAMHIILGRDPAFDMNALLAAIKFDAPVVVKAFLTHDLATLRQHCGPELLERFEGIFKHFQAQNLYEDSTILHVGEVELVELKMMDEEPLLVIQFHCQQIKCTRDQFGNVMDGSPNSIQKVFYFWGLQQEAQGVVLPDGRLRAPRWVIRDMMWQAMLALV